MDLPQELIEEILSHLPSNDRESLLSFSNYSLVSKSWLNPSRRALFANIAIEPSTCDRFLNAISSTNTELLRHVQWLSYLALGNQYRQSHRPIYLLEDYFPSLSQLRALEFIKMQIDPAIPRRLDLLSAFQHALSSLHLADGSISWSGFASLVGYFPGLRDLFIRSMSFGMDDRPVPNPSRALRGKLSLIDLSRNHDMDILVNRLSGLKPEYEEVALGLTVEDQLRVLPLFQETLKVLDIPRYGLKPLGCSLSYRERCSATTDYLVAHGKLWTSRSAQNFKKYISALYIHTSRMCPPSLLSPPLIFEGLSSPFFQSTLHRK